ncbi:Vps16, C-terminal region-domain-containing protein [Phakopsora pachyrhizi]|nr:Vps16, C-terminal region-domain-containing protein [Phakopsora pachyrhizi]
MIFLVRLKLQQVAPSTASVFKPGSTSPAAILFDSLDHFDKHFRRVADEHIHNIKRKLPKAIAACIETAGREYDPRWQECLVRVAAFVFKLSPGLVLQHWAHNLILSTSKATEFASANPSHGVCQKIISNIEGHHSVSPSDKAEIAWSLGKSNLSVELLQHEKKLAKLIPLLIKMEQGGEALNQSIKSLDPDLIHAILWETQARKSLAEFLPAVKGKLEAVSPIRVWAKASIEQNFSSLKDTAKMANFTVGPDWELYPNFCYQDEHHAESACLLLEESYMNFALLSPTWQLYSSEGDSSKRSNGQMKKSFLDSITSNNGLSLPSLNETIRQCIKLGLRKKADRLKVNFKVPDKHFWCLKMKALIGLRDWKSLEAWAGNKSSIGFEVYLFFLIK